ncbi:hypothetical protein Tasa_048_140 [Tanticharoenia sakaeratensis NBRC 103193]|uniref:Uncharacterized protein n=1 Tax=Tanticharoenia sakaeratensis NBRC 103193 TaxID=1231623 RepID=A0A0D6MQ48_9PROT|nr:hypothetical protein Tasa_048_140 [Tanticharoenia sakaeratensis NBRC 103193]GBQ21858.1 hypothetical protein AA103193_1872 [Tanticharoenia sakaeratensis NBRC 103193]
MVVAAEMAAGGDDMRWIRMPASAATPSTIATPMPMTAAINARGTVAKAEGAVSDMGARSLYASPALDADE